MKNKYHQKDDDASVKRIKKLDIYFMFITEPDFIPPVKTFKWCLEKCILEKLSSKHFEDITNKFWKLIERYLLSPNEEINQYDGKVISTPEQLLEAIKQKEILMNANANDLQLTDVAFQAIHPTYKDMCRFITKETIAIYLETVCSNLNPKYTDEVDEYCFWLANRNFTLYNQLLLLGSIGWVGFLDSVTRVYNNIMMVQERNMMTDDNNDSDDD